jgi:putative FmdB family regulatory protein
MPPIYEYACPRCGKTCELIQKLNEPAPKDCPNCGMTVELKKLLTTANPHFHGPGFYTTDYKKNWREPKKGEEK